LDPLSTSIPSIPRYDNNINAFDMANVYSNGESGGIVGKALKEYNIPKENFVVMTKACLSLRR
jgi:aryl-alcohol dehydrogenase-like predicted oxidoreductase